MKGKSLLWLSTLLLSCRFASSNWWLLAMPSAYHIKLEMENDYKAQCRNMAYLMEPQRRLCEISPNMLAIVSQGTQIGLKECQNQFSGSHWNCSTQWDSSLPYYPKKQPKLNTKNLIMRKSTLWKPDPMIQSDAPSPDVGEVFGGSLKFSTRQKAYVHAISASGVAYSITKACSQGLLPSCSCDRDIHLKKATKGKWEWGGCSDDISYGEDISREFVDSTEAFQETDLNNIKDIPAQLMNLHNNEAGRKAMKKNVEMVCKCHGVSGSCTTKICWRKLRDFHFVGETLHKKFNNAIRVKFNKRRHKLKILLDNAIEPLRLKPRKRDLIYLQESPDYCTANHKYGIKGTKGRECDASGFGSNSCQVLCCGRGFITTYVNIERDCGCKFVWCCEVKCKRCKERKHIHRCK